MLFNIRQKLILSAALRKLIFSDVPASSPGCESYHDSMKLTLTPSYSDTGDGSEILLTSYSLAVFPSHYFFHPVFIMKKIPKKNGCVVFVFNFNTLRFLVLHPPSHAIVCVCPAKMAALPTNNLGLATRIRGRW